jgi:predicted nuclease of predicted toxin-antitoxin system
LNKLFTELYLDEDVDVLVADLVRARGFIAITTRDAGNLNKDDDEQLAYAAENQLAYVTHNRADFEARALEYFASGKPHYGIIIAVRRPPQDIVRRLFVILNNVTADEMVNQIRYI